MDKVNLAEKAHTFRRRWSPKTVARLNDYDVQVVKVKGEFVWHKHDDTDDFFLVLKGHLTIQMRDRDIDLCPGELFLAPNGVEHCPRCDEEVHLLLIEPSGTPKTGDAGGQMTATPSGSRKPSPLPGRSAWRLTQNSVPSQVQ